MIATRRGLSILLAILSVLVAVVGLDAGRGPRPPADRAVAPGLDIDGITELSWVRPGQPTVRLEHDHARWRWTAPGRAIADPRAVADVLAALRAARWHRSADAGMASPVHAELTVGGPSPRTIGIGEPLDGAEQAWLVVGDRAVLVDRWVARALEPDPLSLRIRRPFEDAPAATAIAIRSRAVPVRLEGQPRRLTEPPVGLVAPALADAVVRALAAIEIVRLPAHDAPAKDEISIELAGERWTLSSSSGCGDDTQLLYLRGAAGDGCIAATASEALLAAVTRLGAGDPTTIDPRPAPIDAVRITLPDGTVVELASRLQVGGRDADAARVAELLAVLAASAVPVKAIPGPRLGTLRVHGRAGAQIDLDLYPGNRVQRAGERFMLQLTPEAFALLTRPANQLLDPQLWLEEPRSITSVVVDSIVYTSSTSSGTWSRTPAGKFDPAAVTRLAELLAAPRAQPGTISAAAADRTALTKAHEVMITVTPPVGAPITHTVELGAPRPEGCRARTGGLTVTLPAVICVTAGELVH